MISLGSTTAGGGSRIEHQSGVLMKLGWIDRPTKTNDELYYPWAVYRCLLLLDFYCTSHFVGPPLEELPWRS